jgi:hypothetical protein
MAIECAERVVADLGHAISGAVDTQRHQRPGAIRSLRRVIRPSQMVPCQVPSPPRRPQTVEA